MGEACEGMRDGIWAWRVALSGDPAVETRILLASGSSLAFSSPGCLCRDLLEPECGIARAIGPLGRRVEPLRGRDLARKPVRRRVAAYARAGRVVPWFLGEREGVIFGGDETALRTEWVSLSGARGECAFDAETMGDARLYLVRSAPSLRQPRAWREIHQALEFVTQWYAPYAHGGHCVACEGSDTGTASLARMRSSRGQGTDGMPNEGVAVLRRRIWMRRLADAHAAVERMCGRSRTRDATRMRRAAARVGAAYEALGRAEDALPSPGEAAARPRTAFERFRTELACVQDCMEDACGWMLEAACIRAGLPQHYVSLLHGAPDERIAEGQVGDLVYLARAGSVPFRRLAARRLAPLAHARGVAATLRQLLHDADDLTALLAARAILDSGESADAGAFLDAYVRRPIPAQPRAFSVRAELLFDAALADPDRTAAFLDGEGDGWRADFSSAGAARLERVLAGDP